MSLFLRKLWRLLSLVFPVSYLFLNKTQELILLGILLSIELTIEFLRLFIPSLRKFLLKIFGKIIKEKEKNQISSTGIMLLVIFSCVLLFKKEVAILAISFSIIGDSFSALIGKNFGRIKFKNRSLEGSMGFSLSCIAIGLILNNFLSMPVYIIIQGALVASLTEFFTPPFFDDNITVPFATGIFLQILI